MSKRLSPIAFLAAAGIAVAMLVSGCSIFPSPAPAPTTAPTSSAPAAPPATTPRAAPPATTPPTPTAAPTAAGCAPTTATMPAGAVSRTTIDVDGDGVADTEWVTTTPSLQFGVTTASGATYSFSLNTASPAARVGFIARLNDHRIVALTDDNRSASVHFFVNCGWVTTKDSHGAPFALDFNDLAGTGSGVGCSFGYVVQFQATNSATGWKVTKRPLNLNSTGSFASFGPATVVVANASASDSRVKVAQALTCESVTVANGGVTVN